MAEQSSKRTAGENPSHYSSVYPAEGNPWEHVPWISTALSDTRSVTDESTSNRKDAKTLKLEQLPQASRVEPVLGTNSSTSSTPVAMPLDSPCASSLVADLAKQNERSFSPRESRYMKKQSGEYMSKSLSKTAQLDRRWARAEIRTKQRLWFCELPDSPDGSEYAPSSNECDEGDFDYGATVCANQCNQLSQTMSNYLARP